MQYFRIVILLTKVPKTFRIARLFGLSWVNNICVTLPNYGITLLVCIDEKKCDIGTKISVYV